MYICIDTSKDVDQQNNKYQVRYGIKNKLSDINREM